MSESAHLELDRVSKVFPRQGGGGEVRAVDGVSLAIRRGEFVTLLGPSGCGKTTTLRMIAGFELPTAGRIRLAGRDITDQPANRRDMAMVFQSYALFPHLSVAENVAYGLEARGAPRAEIRGRVEKALALMGLEGLAGRRPAQLSGGQQQRVALARCLVLEPSVLLFDEPLSNLDAKLRVQMRTEILALQRRLNITSVYVTHDQAEAMVLSDRIVVMHAGRIEQIGSPREIYRRPASRFVADFIGRANFVPTRVEVVAGGLALVTLLGREARVPASDGLRPGDAATAVLRPEALRLLPKPSGAAGRVEQAMYMGAAVDYVVSLDGALLMVTESDPRGERAFAEGQPVGVDFEPAAVHLLPGAD